MHTRNSDTESGQSRVVFRPLLVILGYLENS